MLNKFQLIVKSITMSTILLAQSAFADIQIININKNENLTKRTSHDSIQNSTKLPSNHKSLDSIINFYAKQYDIPPGLVKAIIKHESSFNSLAVSPKGAKGLMQLMPATAAQYGTYNLLNPIHNIAVGSKHLSYLLNKYDNKLHIVLAAYNAGEGKVSKYGGVPPFRETHNYVLNVLRSYNTYLDDELLRKGLSNKEIAAINDKPTSRSNHSNRGKVLYLSLNK